MTLPKPKPEPSPPPLPANKIPLCHWKSCALRGINDQAFSAEEAKFFLERPEIYPLCYGCKSLLRKYSNTV